MVIWNDKEGVVLLEYIWKTPEVCFNLLNGLVKQIVYNKRTLLHMILKKYA